MSKFILILSLASYVFVLILIGIYSRKESGSVKDYYAAGKKLRYWIVSFSTNATGESSWLLLGLSGMGFAFGVHALWVMVDEVLGVAFAWIFMARRFKVYTDMYKSITIPDFLEDRFDDKLHVMRVISAIILLPMIVSYVAAQLTASGKVFKAFLQIDFVPGIIIGLAIILFYTVIGGITAVARADFFHGLLMILGLLVLPIVAIIHCGGFEGMLSALKSIDSNLLKLSGPTGYSF